jgi:L-ribulose-5-phosphate 3-epimerase UlaE
MDLEYTYFVKNLQCLLDNSRSGKYSLFIYPDDPNMTIYHEDTKKELYLPKEKFKQDYKIIK